MAKILTISIFLFINLIPIGWYHAADQTDRKYLQYIMAISGQETKEINEKHINFLLTPLESSIYGEVIKTPTAATLELLRMDKRICPIHILVTEGREVELNQIMKICHLPLPKTSRGETPLSLSCKEGMVGLQQILCGRSPNDSNLPAISVNLSKQILIFRGAKKDEAFKISTGKRETPTKPGLYVITQKLPFNKTANGKTLASFQRLSNSAIGIHSGYVKNAFSSNGCIRLTEADARYLFLEAIS